MKRIDLKKRTAVRTLLALAIVAGTASCEGWLSPDGECGMRISFQDDGSVQTRAGVSVADTNSFILTVTDSKGKSIYQGAYGAAPSTLLVSPGKYEVVVASAEFNAPAFDCPVYGDSQSVTVKSGRVESVVLMCRQINAGIRLRISRDFLTAYPNASLFLKAKEGKLLYSYTEKRTAYFSPGTVTLMMSDGGADKTLLSRSMASQEILTLNIAVASGETAAGAEAGRISIQMDTSRVWSTEDYIIGGDAARGSSKDSPLSIGEARGMSGKEDVWVYGYIVGGDLSSSKASFSAPFSSKTNIVLAARSSERNKNNCLSVQLTSGSIRDALNLSDNPSNLGKSVCLKGNLVPAYYGIPGMQSVTEYVFR